MCLSVGVLCYVLRIYCRRGRNGQQMRQDLMIAFLDPSVDRIHSAYAYIVHIHNTYNHMQVRSGQIRSRVRLVWPMTQPDMQVTCKLGNIQFQILQQQLLLPSTFKYVQCVGLLSFYSSIVTHFASVYCPMLSLSVFLIGDVYTVLNQSRSFNTGQRVL